MGVTQWDATDNARNSQGVRTGYGISGVQLVFVNVTPRFAEEQP